jgi:uncharacterized protein with PIN domain
MENRLKFILTVDAQKLAKWLRLLGYDTKVIKSVAMLNLIRIAKKDKRIIISRSKSVLNHPLEFDRIFIHSDQLEEQLLELKPWLKYDENYLFTRCPEDNEILKDIAKDKILNLIPEKVAQLHDEFKVCQKCGRVYWQGSHYQKIMTEIQKVFAD